MTMKDRVLGMLFILFLFAIVFGTMAFYFYAAAQH